MSMKTRAVSRCWEDFTRVLHVAPHDTGRLRPVCFLIQGPHKYLLSKRHMAKTCENANMWLESLLPLPDLLPGIYHGQS
jgi:hypothetical protein